MSSGFSKMKRRLPAKRICTQEIVFIESSPRFEPQSRTVDKFTNYATNDDIQILIFKFTRKIGVPTFNHHTCLYLLSILAANNISIFSIFNDPVVDVKKLFWQEIKISPKKIN